MSVTSVSNGVHHVHQRVLFHQLRSVFPSDPIHVDVKKEISIKYAEAGSSYMQFDIWMPTFTLCFEFQDSYHYTSAWYYNNPQEHISNKDNEKKVVALRQGLSLIAVPCWWDSTHASLVATILFARPDMIEHVTSDALPIFLNPPHDFFKAQEIPNIGEIMLASFQLLDRSLIDFSNSDWWIGEKYDGMRCCWNPTLQKLYSRHGREFAVLLPITSHFPDIFVDSEIWFGRGQFSATFSIVHEEAQIPWTSLRAISFDIPSIDAEKLPFEYRYANLLSAFSAHHSFNVTAPRILSTSIAHVEYFLTSTLEEGGEGLIVQRHGSHYARGRSPFLFKFKSFEEDKEAIVCSIAEDDSVILKLPDSSTFKVPAEDVNVPNLKIGDVVTFTFERGGRDVPTNPKIYRIRSDLSWDDVLHSFQDDKRYSKESHSISNYHQKQYWTHKNMRAYMERYAQNRNLDPLLPETWFSSFSSFSRSRNGKLILGKFKSEYFSALKNLFPEVAFDNSMQNPVWSNIENRRKFFESYAATRGFDPLVPTHWYLQSHTQIMSEKGAQAIILYHKNSVALTLLDLFPNIGLDIAKLKAHLSAWENETKRKRFFAQYAALHDFDPKDALRWYEQPKDKILAFKGAKRVIAYHDKSIAQALFDLFPDIGLEPSKLTHLAPWHSIEANRRAFFDNYARTNGFDPLSAASWYAQTRSNILATKGAFRVLSYYANSITKALVLLYPELMLNPTELYKSFSPWGNAEKSRRFFENFANQNKFDPLIARNWYEIPKQTIMDLKGVRGVLFYHADSIAKALVELFPEIGLRYSKFRTHSGSAWSDETRQRQFFVDYAKLHSFDPLNPVDWYLQSKRNIFEQPGARTIADFHEGSITQALLDLFPKIGLDKNKLQNRKRGIIQHSILQSMPLMQSSKDRNAEKMSE